ncbi:MAG: NAD(P)-dependent alcohol dehydrogenase [Betaproteobacteria bacterium]|nr:NAD(P)-dependent alcohol dehydrogenase [Betaproteobacteria bacterium]
MQALRYDRYGPADRLYVAEVPEPACPAGGFKLRVRAVGLNPLDWKIRAGHLALVPVFDRPPRGVGCDFAGEIVGVGGGATRHFVGQRVFGSLPPFGRQGALAEMIAVAGDQVTAIPDGVGFATAAALPIAGGTAVQALEDHAQLQPGQKLLVTGAAGGVGHFAVQLGKHLGATVTAVCGPANVDFVRGLGADAVIDYTHEDFLRRNENFDVVFDAACSSDYLACRRVLVPTGVYVNTSGSAGAALRTMGAGIYARLATAQRAVALVLANRRPMWERLGRYAAAGVLRPQIAPPIGLTGVAAAQRTMETGHGRGKIVVTLP